MKIADFARPGDRIDITYLHQNNGKVYKSSVCDYINDSVLEISMPTESGKMILFQVGFECSLFFYTQKGMYTCEGKVIDRYKRDGFYLLSMKITSTPKKYQRREYYRVDNSMEFLYYPITKEIAELETTGEIFDEITNPEYIEKKKIGRTKDLSGGGIRFIASEGYEKDSYLLVVLPLKNDKVEQTLYLVMQVIESFAIENLKDKMIVRGKFIFKEAKDRELIVRYVFEEDRMRRKKDSGN